MARFPHGASIERLTEEIRIAAGGTLKPLQVFEALVNAILRRVGLSNMPPPPATAAHVADFLLNLYIDVIREAPAYADILGPVYRLLSGTPRFAAFDEWDQALTAADKQVDRVAEIVGRELATGHPAPDFKVTVAQAGLGAVPLAVAHQVAVRMGAGGLDGLRLIANEEDSFQAAVAAAQILANWGLRPCRLKGATVTVGRPGANALLFAAEARPGQPDYSRGH